MKSIEFIKDVSKIIENAYGNDCVEQFFDEYPEPKDVIKWVEDELSFYNTDGFAQFEMKEYAKEDWRKNVRQLKNFLKKYKRSIYDIT